MSNNVQRQFSIRILILILPMFAIWWYANTWIANTLAIPVGFAIATTYEREQINLEAKPSGIWILHTGVLSKLQSQPNKTLEVLSLQVDSATKITLGFPILWIFILSVAESISKKIRKLSFSTLIFSLLISALLYLDSSVRILQFLSGNNLGKIFLGEGLYQNVIPPTPWLVIFLEKLLLIMAYFVPTIAPLIIFYQFNKKFVRVILLAGLLDHAIKNKKF